LTPEEQQQFLQAVERRRSARDRALALILFYTGIKIGECFALDVDDVILTSHTGRIKVHSGESKKNACRELVLNEATRKAVLAWLIERSEKSPIGSESALFLNSRGNRLAIAGIDFVIRSIGWNARIGLSAQILRRTFLVNQLKSGQSPCSVAHIAGHKGPETIRRYLGHNQLAR
jgi:site-specific recombinase XerD